MSIPVVIAGQKSNYSQRTRSYDVTIAVADWIGTGEDSYTATKSLPALKCGLDGTIPPIIAPINDESEYSNITSAEVTAGVGIEFTISELPKNAISMIVVDFS